MIPALADIRRAAAEIAGSVLRTPFLPSPRLSALTGADVHVKYENLQATASFKERGALIKLGSLTAAERERGVVTLSAGNHAQAVAYHAARLGLPATIVMPAPTPFVKVAATRGFGAKVLLEGETLSECRDVVAAVIAATGATMIHPYDDAEVIRGQGTVGLEMIEDGPPLDAIVVPVGGGGLIAGVAIAVKALSPKTEVIGVETELYPSLRAAMRGEVAACGGESLAEGIAVKHAGALPAEIARRLVDDIVLAPEVEIERAVAEFLTRQKTLAEGAGAAPLAALLAFPERFAGRRVGLILAGGNIDPRLAASIMVRELAREERIVSLRLTISDRPGMLGDIAATIGAKGGNILEVFHHRTMLRIPPKGASLDLVVETHGPEHAAELIGALSAKGYRVEMLDPPAGSAG